MDQHGVPPLAWLAGPLNDIHILETGFVLDHVHVVAGAVAGSTADGERGPQTNNR